jgi:hypothetical protein
MALSIEWRKEGLREDYGLLVSASEETEWILPWWWLNYRIYNSYPVTFVDLGMTAAAIKWCENKGEVIKAIIPQDFMADQLKITSRNIKLWEEIGKSRVWQQRKEWFKRPFILLQTPYKRTLWADINSQIRSYIDEFFDSCNTPAGISLVRETEEAQQQNLACGLIPPGEVLYKTNIIAYDRNSQVIRLWIEKCINENMHFFNDQYVLSHILSNKECRFIELPDIYNWRVAMEVNPNAIINHCTESWGYGRIKENIRLLTENLLMHLSVSADQYL